MTTTNSHLNNVRFFGYPIEARLYKKVEKTITEINTGGNTEHLCELAADVLIDITDEGFDAYYERPAELAKVSPRVKRASDAGMHAVQKGIHMVIRKLLKNRSLKDLKRLANDLAYLICVDNENPSQAYACFVLPEELYQRILHYMKRVHDDPNVESYRQDVISSLEDLIAAGVDNFYTKPVKQADIGRITRKAADLGIHTVQKGSNAVVYKVFKDMDHATLLPMAKYMESLLHSEVKTYKQRFLTETS